MSVDTENKAFERLCQALVVIEAPEEAAALLSDICSPAEIEAITQRLEVAELLDVGASYIEVSKRTGASSTTVSRVSKCLNGPAGGYRVVLDRLGEK